MEDLYMNLLKSAILDTWIHLDTIITNDIFSWKKINRFQMKQKSSYIGHNELIQNTLESFYDLVTELLLN